MEAAVAVGRQAVLYDLRPAGPRHWCCGHDKRFAAMVGVPTQIADLSYLDMSIH